MSNKTQKKLRNVFLKLKEPTKICVNCFKEEGDKTFRKIFHKNITMCDKCFNDFSIKFYRFKVLDYSCLSLYDYDDVFRNRLYQLKGCFDIVLAKSFLETFCFELSLIYYGYFIVPVPSNLKDDEIRGFNHVVEVFKNIKLKMIKDVFYKSQQYKQSSQTYKNRKQIEHIINIKNIDLTNKKILLVDDVITSGSTIKTCIKLLEKKNVKTIKILTLSVSKNNEFKKESMLKKALAKFIKINNID